MFKNQTTPLRDSRTAAVKCRGFLPRMETCGGWAWQQPPAPRAKDKRRLKIAGGHNPRAAAGGKSAGPRRGVRTSKHVRREESWIGRSCLLLCWCNLYFKWTNDGIVLHVWSIPEAWLQYA
ncbi:uncharacterized protein LOC126950061 isoform X2 [Macaca thibetana thibetana]|uniref:uncharacterized protein LOC126950061 isoform X2 n=1 Tax=Macaca thibetana thibetana TaxID=257877 RepID=UPI0021BC3DF7|nr:uncharacterized protein LOC126950061 isoform X2 [Macaca thibetana thibetana]